MKRHLLRFLLVFALFAVGLAACETATDRPADGDTPDGDTPDGDEPDGDTPDGDAPDGDAPDGDMPDGDGDGDDDGDEADGDVSPPECGSGVYTGRYLIAGPGEESYDADLALKADRYERQFHLFAAAPYTGATDAEVPLSNDANRDLLTRFLTETDSWDFEGFSGGTRPDEVVTGWFKTAGLYAGMGIAADALRYQTLRDQGAACAEIDRARETLVKALDFLHIAFTIGGVPGVVARGLVRRDVPGFAQGVETLPLFDDEDKPLPPVKNNGEWREDNSGQYPGWVWEDSCSRDMLLGWAAAAGVGMDVIRSDASFSEELRQRLRDDAKMVLDGLRVVRSLGYDLELIDADGRTTLHGYLNERAVESALYDPRFQNGFYSLMALGIVAAFAYTSGEADGLDYLYTELIEQRELPRIAAEHPTYINMGAGSNYSNYNMAFTAAWLALRYIDHADAREKIMTATRVGLYDTPGETFQPVGAKMSLYDFIVAYGDTGASIHQSPTALPEPQPVADGLETLRAFVTPPYWDLPVVNCDEAELESGQCVLLDGTELEVYSEGGRKGSTVCSVPVPKAVRRPSNYEWRSNPYEPNGGGNGANLLSGVDFRVAYWIGRSIRLPD